MIVMYRILRVISRKITISAWNWSIFYTENDVSYAVTLTYSTNMCTSFLKCFLALGLSASVSLVQGQTIQSSGTNPIAKKPKPLTREISGGFRLNSDGWSVFAERGSIRSQEGRNQDMFNSVRLLQIELTEHKHPKELKQTPTDQSGDKAKPFIYGKINNFYALKLGYGIRTMVAGKPEPGTVSIHWANTLGLALGMEKPYYIDGYLQQDKGAAPVPATFKYSEENRQSFTDLNYIKGAGGFTKGLGEIQMIPGLHLKSALHFDFAANRKTVLAIETGVNIEYYSRPVTMMVDQDKQSLFANMFASFQFGRRK
jgi:hypothetical protein